MANKSIQSYVEYILMTVLLSLAARLCMGCFIYGLPPPSAAAQSAECAYLRIAVSAYCETNAVTGIIITYNIY